MKTYSAPHWQIHIPDDWIDEDDDGCIALYHPDGYGMLEITAAPQDEPIALDDLRVMASEHLEAGAKPQPVKIGAFEGLEIDYDDGEFYWREWYVRHDKVMLFITYNCALGDEEREEAMVDVVLATLKARPDDGEHAAVK